MTKKMFLIMLLAALLVFPTFGDESRKKIPANQYSQGFGLMAGMVSGWGLSYQHWFDDVGIKVSGVAFTGQAYTPTPDVNTTGSYQDKNFYSIGIEGMFPLLGHEPTDWLSGSIYLVGGVSFGNPFIPESTAIAAGFGFGIETLWFKHWAFSLEVLETIDIATLSFIILPQAGFHFKF